MSRPVTLLLAALVVIGALPAIGTGTAPAVGDGDTCIDNLAFYTTHLPDNPPPFRVGFSADGGDAVFFVLETRGRVVGHTDLKTYSGTMHVDGLRVPLTRDVAGVRNVTVTAYQDSNEDGEFDAETDEPCTNDGAPVTSSLDFFVSGDGTGLSDTTVNASPSVAHQSARWTVETTVERDMNVTHVDIDFRQAGPVGIVSPEDVRVGYSPPVNATFAMVGQPADVSVHRDGVLRLSYPDGIGLENGSRLTVRVDGVRVPAESANVTLALSTPDAGYAATDSVDPKPVPHLEFYEGFPEEGVHLRYGLPKDVTMFAVVFHDGEIVGTEYLSHGMAMTADGKPMQVDGVAGEAELTVRAYADTNGNGFFDPDVDQPFVESNGNPVGETAVIDLPGTTTPSSAPPTVTSTRTKNFHDTPMTTSTAVTTPGMGVVAMFGALLCAFGLHARD